MNKFLTALGALTVGAAAVYLSDPEQGRRRRALLRRRVAAAYGQGLEAIEDAGREAAGQVHAAGSRLQDAAAEGRDASQGLLRRARSLAGDVADEGQAQGRQGLRQLRELAAAGRERLSARLHGARHELQSELPRDRRGPGLGTALLTAAALAALGAAAMHLLDSQQGRRRLAQARDRVSHLGEQAMARVKHWRAQEEPPGQGSHMAELGAPADPWRPEQAPGHERSGAALH